MKAIIFAFSFLVITVAANTLSPFKPVHEGADVIPSEFLYNALFDQGYFYDFEESADGQWSTLRKISKCFVEHELERRGNLIQIVREILMCSHLEENDFNDYLSDDKTSKKLQFSTSLAKCQTNDSGCIFATVLEELKIVKKESGTPLEGRLSCIEEKLKKLVELIMLANRNLIVCVCDAGMSCTVPSTTTSTEACEESTTRASPPTTTTRRSTTTSQKPSRTTKKHKTTTKKRTTTRKYATATPEPW